MKNQVIELLKTNYSLNILWNSALPKEVELKLEKYFNDYIETDEYSAEEILENFEECYPEVEFILKDYVLVY